MVRPGDVIKANLKRQDYYARKYQVHLTMWGQQQVLNQLMQ
jgi:hypothetical protein